MSAPAQSDPDLGEALARIAQQADAFRRVAPGVSAEETLNQRSRPPDTRDPQIVTAPFQTREVISQYGFAALHAAPLALHEFRKVISVDGRRVTTAEKARHAMILGLHSDSDRQKKAFLEDFEKHGLHGAVTDFGQLLLLFGARRQQDFDFHFAAPQQSGADPVFVLGYKQVAGPESLTVFRGNSAERQSLEGEIWLRQSDYLPLRITMVSSKPFEKATIRDEAAVDYAPGQFGAVLPVSVVHRNYLDKELLSENIFHYSAFRKLQ